MSKRSLHMILTVAALSFAAQLGCAEKPGAASTGGHGYYVLAELPAGVDGLNDGVASPGTRVLDARQTALRAKIEVTLHNIANTDTTAYKRQRVVVAPLPGSDLPVAQVAIDEAQGKALSTGRALDVAIQGAGWFCVRSADGRTAYTRNGNFFVDSHRHLVVGIGDGYELEPAVTVPMGVSDAQISIATDGCLYATRANTNAREKLGQLRVATFRNSGGLGCLDGSLVRETPLSGPSTLCLPGEHGSGEILEDYLECSNVDGQRELVIYERTKGELEEARRALFGEALEPRTLASAAR
jgi:flagellar basal-body rod protein FlgG